MIIMTIVVFEKCGSPRSMEKQKHLFNHVHGEWDKK